APSILLLGMVEANLKDCASSVRLLASVPELAQQHPQSLAALARCEYNMDQIDEARAALAKLVSHFHDSQSIFLAGEMAEEAGDGTTAERFFSAIRSTFPDQPRLAYHFAHAEYLSGNQAGCQRALLQLIHGGYRTSEAYDLLGQSYAKQNKMREATEAFEDAIALSPAADTYYLDLASTLMGHNLRDTAIQVLTACVKALPRSFDCYESKGKAEISQHYYKESAASFRQAMRLNRSSAGAEAGLGASLAGLGNMREASAAYQAAIQSDPYRAEFYREYGQILLTEAGHSNAALLRRAAALLEKAISLDPSDGEARLLLGQLRLNEGKTREALPLLRSAARLDPQNARPHYLLWGLYQKLGRSNDAASELATFKKLSLRSHQPEASRQ
ncbi:MAG: tetratricopeptide repeat protein, partial [Terriglobia bacterium]